MTMQYHIYGNELIIEGNRINERLMIPEGEDAQTWSASYVATLVDSDDDTFKASKKIRQDAFVDRFSAAELNAIVVAAGADRVVQVIRDTLFYLTRPHINLDAPKVVKAVNYLKNQGILDGADAAAKEVRAIELLADGQSSEAVGV